MSTELFPRALLKAINQRYPSARHQCEQQDQGSNEKSSIALQNRLSCAALKAIRLKRGISAESNGKLREESGNDRVAGYTERTM